MTTDTRPAFTPGPLAIDEVRYVAGVHYKGRLYGIETERRAMQGGEPVAYVRSEADAHLIAAAPELYEALRGASDALEKWNGSTSSSEDRYRARESAKVALIAARAALAKAEGRP